MPPENHEDEHPTQLMSMAEAEGRGRQWMRDVNDAYKVFHQRLPMITRMSDARRGSKVKRIRSLAQKTLAPAFVLATNTKQGCDLYLLDVSEKGQLGLLKLTINHDGGTEILQMNVALSLHFIARILQYYRIRNANPLKNKNVHKILSALRHIDGQTMNSKMLVHDDEGVLAEICCKVEKLSDEQSFLTATTFIIKNSLYPERLQAAEEMRELLLKKGK